MNKETTRKELPVPEVAPAIATLYCQVDGLEWEVAGAMIDGHFHARSDSDWACDCGMPGHIKGRPRIMQTLTEKLRAELVRLAALVCFDACERKSNGQNLPKCASPCQTMRPTYELLRGKEASDDGSHQG